MEIVLIANEKGGAGKTATAVCLANALVALGYKVLTVDFDPSGNLTGGAVPNYPALVLYDVFNGTCSLEDAICHTEICDILPTVRELDLNEDPDEEFLLESADNKSLTHLAERLIGRAGGEKALKSLLRSKKHDLASKYDFIIIDSGPSDNILVTNGIVAADSVLIPCDPSADSLDGVWKLISSMNTARRSYIGANAQVDGIVLTKYSEKTASYRRCIKTIESATKARNLYLYETRMRLSANIPDAMENCRPILSFLNTSGVGAVDALNLALEFLAARGLEPKTDLSGVVRDSSGNWVYNRETGMIL